MTGIEMAALKGFASTLWRYKAWLMVAVLGVVCAFQHQKLNTYDAKEALRIKTVHQNWQKAVDTWKNTYVEADAHAKAQQLQRYREVSDWQRKYQAQVTQANQKADNYAHTIKTYSNTLTTNRQRMQQLLNDVKKQANAAEADAYTECLQATAATPRTKKVAYQLRPAGAVLEVTTELLAETGAFAETVSENYNLLKAEYVRVLDAWPQDEAEHQSDVPTP